jgi:phosphate transport system protein
MSLLRGSDFEEKIMYHHEANYLRELLVTLRTRLLVMCASVSIALEESGKALLAGDLGQANSVIENDTTIDALENEIDERVLRLLARVQPVAGDLRFVISALRMVVDLERIGDEAVHIAEQAILMQDKHGMEIFPQMREMVYMSRSAFEDAVRIFRDSDAVAALQLSKSEDEATQYEVRLLQAIMEGLTNPESGMESYLAMHMILIARSLTRIWRRSVNIAEHVYFISQGASLKHMSEEAKDSEACKWG